MILRTQDAYEQALPPDVHKVASANPSKMYRYGQEAYYQECSNDLAAVLKGPLSEYSSYTFIVIKPDAFVCRAGHRVIEKVKDCGFEVCGGLRFEFNRHMWRELWRYELNVARVARYKLIDDLLCGLPSLFVLLRDCSGSGDASIRLSEIKGNTDQTVRSADTLRSQIQARAGTLNFLHCPDEFMDVVREIGVLFDHSKRIEIARWMDGASSSQSVQDHVNQIEADCPQHDLRLETLKEALGPEFAWELQEDEALLRENPYALYPRYVREFGLSKWDWICVAATYLVYSHKGTPRVLDFEVPV